MNTTSAFVSAHTDGAPIVADTNRGDASRIGSARSARGHRRTRHDGRDDRHPARAEGWRRHGGCSRRSSSSASPRPRPRTPARRWGLGGAPACAAAAVGGVDGRRRAGRHADRTCRSAATSTRATCDRRSRACRRSCRWPGWRWRFRRARPRTRRSALVRRRPGRVCSSGRPRSPPGTCSSTRRWSARGTGDGSERGVYRGIPVTNFAGWFVTGVAVMLILERALPAQVVHRCLAPIQFAGRRVGAASMRSWR